jgi:hypothetical protein
MNELTSEKINYFKIQAGKAALELSAEKNKIILNEIIFNLIKE